MLFRSHRATALAVAQQAGIAEECVRAGMSPEEKARQVEQLTREPRAASLRELHLGMVAELDDALARRLVQSPFLRELGVL